MKKHQIGTTGITVSHIGLGTVKFGRNQGVKYPQSFNLPSDHDITELLAVARDLGVNLVDTAPAYGVSEERLGKALAGKRHDWVVCTKAGEEFADGESKFDFSEQAIRFSVDRSLKRLRTDYLDIVLVHSSGEDMSIIEHDRVFTTLDALKREGKLRAYGMSTKTIAGGRETVASADIAMVAYNPTYVDERVIIQEAQQRNKGIFIKKALGSGHLPATESLAFVLNEPGVTSVIVGTINAAHLGANVAMANTMNFNPDEVSKR